MRHYETILVFSNKLTEEEFYTAVFKYKDCMNSLRARCVTKCERVGLKKLAYPVKNCSHGYYVIFEHTSSKDEVEKLKDFYEKDTRIIKHLTVLMDEEELEDDTPESEQPDGDAKQQIDALDIILGLVKY